MVNIGTDRGEEGRRNFNRIACILTPSLWPGVAVHLVSVEYRVDASQEAWASVVFSRFVLISLLRICLPEEDRRALLAFADLRARRRPLAVRRPTPGGI